MKHLTTIADYCQHIHVRPPRYPDFDCRTFDENMPTVKRRLDPIKHEFYAVGLLFEGTSHNWHGIPNLNANIVFNSPYQLISWDIENDWSGCFFMFSQDFLMNCHFGTSLLDDFPFLKLDRVKPISVPEEQLQFLKRKFDQIHDEYYSDHPDKFKFIESYVNLVLLSIKRFVGDSQENFFASEQNRNADLKVVSRYQTLIDTMLNSPNSRSDYFATSFYADRLAIHPNHLNAIVKRITGKTAKQVIQDKVLLMGKALLQQSDMSIKEVAHRLGYEEATHFGSFFKKETGLTPAQFKKLATL